ncbi:MAG TPA: TIGR02300 family protein [Anaeromyxobacteraceae bacterium]|nr:TIGR02300 family protein [Anaeromyxobacteraceae bacterium]
MPAKDLGTKHTCWKCGTKYYDLKKPSPACPKCGADPRQAPVVKAPSAAERKRAKPVPAEAPEVVEEAELDEELDEADEEPADDADDES